MITVDERKNAEGRLLEIMPREFMSKLGEDQ